LTGLTRVEVDFGVFLLHRIAERWHKPVPETYSALHESGILDDYIFPCYDTLHTLGTDYLVDDITDMAKERGVAI
jgi:hypothetical protein